MPSTVEVNATSSFTPCNPATHQPSQTRLATLISAVEQGQQHLAPPDSGVQARTGDTAVAKNEIVFPAYWGGFVETPWDVINDQDSFYKTCTRVVDYLSTQPLAEEEILYALENGFFQTHLGKLLADHFIEAMMRSIKAKGELTTEQLREIVETICKLPSREWATVFGERLNFPRGTDRNSVIGFIQSQLELSRLHRDEKIANGELLTDAQWQCLQQIVKQCRSSIRPWQEERLNSTLMKLEDCAKVRGSPEESKFLLGEFLQRLNEPRRERFPDRHKRAVKALWQSIELKTAPSLLEDFRAWVDPAPIRTGLQRLVDQTNSALNTLGTLTARDLGEALYKEASPILDRVIGAISMAGLVFRTTAKPSASGPVATSSDPMPLESEDDFSVMQTLEEIQRKSDPYLHVNTSGPRIPNGIAARLMYAGYISHEASELVSMFSPSGSTPSRIQAPPMAPEPEPSTFFSVNLFEQFERLFLKIDEVFTSAIQGASGWSPAAAVELNDLNTQIKGIRAQLMAANVKTPFASVPPSSYGSVGNPYADTVEQNEPDTLDKLRDEITKWLQTTAGYLAAAGVVTFNSVAVAAQQHPRGAATVALSAIYAVVNEFHGRWFGDTVPGEQLHFATQTSPELITNIVFGVESSLITLPGIVEAVRERIANSTYDDPHQDPQLVSDVAELLEEPVPWNSNMTASEWIFKVGNQQQKDYYQSHAPASLNDDEDAAEPTRSQRSKRAAQWTLEVVSDSSVLSDADKELQSNVIAVLESERDVPVPIPTGALIHPSVELYKQAVNDKALLAFFTAKGMDLSSMRIYHSSVAGFVTENGQSTLRAFDLWDNSGWWPAAKSLLPVLKLLDPDNSGLCHVNTASDIAPRNVVLTFYGVSPPLSTASAKLLASQLQTSGWPAFSTGKEARLNKAVEQVKQAVEETQARAQLVSALELAVMQKADNVTVNLSAITADFVSTKLTQASQKIRHHLNDFLALPAMIELCEAQKTDCSAYPVRVSEQKIEIFFEDKWSDLTGAVNAKPALKVEFDKLLEQVKESGNALYTSTSCDLQQVVRFSGFDAPQNAGEVRNIIRWLTTSIPPSPPLGNYGADLLGGGAETVTLSSAEKTMMTDLINELLDGSPSIIQALGADLLLDTSLAHRRTHAHRLLTEMLDTDMANSWGQQLLEELNWYGADSGQAVSAEHCHLLLCAAIKLGIDPDATGEFGKIAGYDIYQPSNMGRDLGAIRTDIENHLIENKGVSALTAPLVAHLFLADVAPEFLVACDNLVVRMGSDNWMMLRLGVSIAEATAEGCSRLLEAKALIALAVLDPASNENRLLFQALGVDILVAWGVMNGIVQQRSASVYSPADYENASKMYALQRAEITKSFEAFNRPLKTRREMAIIELRNMFPGASDREIARMKLWSNYLGAAENHHNVKGTTHDLVEVYMAGELNPTDWWQPSRCGLSPNEWEKRVRALPDLSKLFQASVDSYYEDYSKAFIAPTKRLFAELPFEDRQCLELGTVELFTLREETGRIKADETPELQAAARGGYGTLIRCEYGGQTRYFEVFPAQLKIVKRMDLPKVLPLNGVMKIEKVRMAKGLVNDNFQRGTDLPFDFQAYREGCVPRPDTTSSKLIIEKLGGTFAAGSLVGNAVPLGYFSPKLDRLVNAVINDNFLQGQKEALFQWAKGVTNLESHNQFWANVKDFAIQLIPFVGCVNDLSAGTRMGLINGAFSCFTDSISLLVGVGQGTIKAAKAVKSFLPVKTKAFELMKISAGTVNSIVNPLSGVPDLISGAVRGVYGLGRMLMSCAFKLPDNVWKFVQTAVDKLRAFCGGAASSAAKNLPGWVSADRAISRVTYQGTNITAISINDKWYRLDSSGKPFGPELVSVTPLNP